MFLVIVLIHSFLVCSSVTEEIPEHATIRLTVVFDREAIAIVADMKIDCETFAKKSANLIQQTLHSADLGLHLQVVHVVRQRALEHRRTNLQTPQDYWVKLNGGLVFQEYESEFLILLSGKQFTSGFHTQHNLQSRAGLACSEAYNMVLLRDIRTNATLPLKQVARSMTATLLYSLGTSIRARVSSCGSDWKCCTCKGECILSDLSVSQSMVIPKCTKEFIAQSVPNCLKTQPNASRSVVSICGNGFRERWRGSVIASIGTQAAASIAISRADTTVVVNRIWSIRIPRHPPMPLLLPLLLRQQVRCTQRLHQTSQRT